MISICRFFYLVLFQVCLFIISCRLPVCCCSSWASVQPGKRHTLLLFWVCGSGVPHRSDCIVIRMWPGSAPLEMLWGNASFHLFSSLAEFKSLVVWMMEVPTSLMSVGSGPSFQRLPIPLSVYSFSSPRVFQISWEGQVLFSGESLLHFSVALLDPSLITSPYFKDN